MEFLFSGETRFTILAYSQILINVSFSHNKKMSFSRLAGREPIIYFLYSQVQTCVEMTILCNINNNNMIQYILFLFMNYAGYKRIKN